MSNAVSIPAPSRYKSFTTHLRQTFGCRVQKVSIDAGFTCPNRDGNLAVGGCIYCNNSSFSPTNKRLSVTEQIEQGKSFLGRRYGAKKFIAYFQAVIPIRMAILSTLRTSMTKHLPAMISLASQWEPAPTA